MNLQPVSDWYELLQSEFEQPYYQELVHTLKQEYNTTAVFPPKELVFNALHETSYKGVKVVLLGQDPYHGAGQAHGLSFSVLPGVPAPPSLRNMFKELHSDLGCPIPDHGCLLPWAKQGVLLLNTVLTVREGEANSHKGIGWERLTDSIITRLNDRKEPVLFVLWGNYAQQKSKLITAPQHSILCSAHPSPLSAHRGFFGSRPFSRINEWLRLHRRDPVEWQLPNRLY